MNVESTLIAANLQRAASDLSREVSQLSFAAPVAFTYNPLDYAWEAHKLYIERYGAGRREVVLLGMNPGPFGMAQTGVPFGEVAAVRDWMGIHVRVKRPAAEHPKRPVEGFDCPRSEVSGARLWGWAKSAYGTPAKFFEKFFVLNYCPLVFMSETGANITPDKLAPREREVLQAICDSHLKRAVELLKPRFAIGVGKFAEDRLKKALPDFQGTIGQILHPSPASPAANKDWEGTIKKQLAAMGV